MGICEYKRGVKHGDPSSFSFFSIFSRSCHLDSAPPAYSNLKSTKPRHSSHLSTQAQLTASTGPCISFTIPQASILCHYPFPQPDPSTKIIIPPFTLCLPLSPTKSPTLPSLLLSLPKRHITNPQHKQQPTKCPPKHPPTER